MVLVIAIDLNLIRNVFFLVLVLIVSKVATCYNEAQNFLSHKSQAPIFST